MKGELVNNGFADRYGVSVSGFVFMGRPGLVGRLCSPGGHLTVGAA